VFDLGAQELIVIFVVALLVFGPKRLPELARTMGKGIGQLKKAVFDIKSQVDAEVSGVEGDIREHIPAWKDVASKFPDLTAERDALRDSLWGSGEAAKTGETEPEGSKRTEDAPGPQGRAGAGGKSDAYADEHHAVETEEQPLEEEPPPKESSA
jgi:Tat protein translocase TatB subunit